ncbi:MAG: hypothetical protein AYK18_11440 [Theionarchaea archaeon DG-70]|nr:MAG: hypothetical protein AYK18_11440 [Theionarchaea archaeon DG-70]
MKKAYLAVLVPVLLIITYWHPAGAATWHVNPGDSIQAAINNASAGDTIFVHSSVYTEQIVINKSVKLIGDGAGTTVIQHAGGLVLVHVNTVNTTVELAGFTLRHTGTVDWSNSYALLVENGAYASIHDNVVDDFKKRGIYVEGNNSSADITGNTVIGEGPCPGVQNGIVIWGSGGGFANIIGNKVSHMYYTGGFWGSTGIMILDTFDKTVVVANNAVHDTQLGMGVGDYCGISHAGSYTLNVTIKDNRITDNTGGIEVINDARGTTIEYNSILRNTEYGIAVTDYVDYGWACGQPTDTVINYNDIIGNGIGLSVNSRVDLVDARYNCWGHWTGPGGGFTDPNTGQLAHGNGDTIDAAANNALFDPWLPCRLPSQNEPQSGYGEQLCPLARYNVQKAEEMLETVHKLFDQAFHLKVNLLAVEELIAEAEDLLEKATCFCKNSQNCVAGNTLALEAQKLLREAQEMLESMLS